MVAQRILKQTCFCDSLAISYCVNSTGVMSTSKKEITLYLENSNTTEVTLNATWKIVESDTPQLE